MIFVPQYYNLIYKHMISAREREEGYVMFMI